MQQKRHLSSRHLTLPLPEARDYRHIRVKPAGPAIGAAVSGVDLSRPREPEVYAEIADALWRHHVLFFREQDLPPEAHRALAGSFGPSEVHEIFDADASHPEISILENDADRPPEINVWHTDVTYRPNPSLCSILYCEVAPEAGGDTMWLNQQVAFDTMSAPIRELLLGLEAEHDVLQAYSGSGLLERAGGEAKVKQLRAENPPTVHPVVIAHPITGRPGLRVNSTFTRRILGLRGGESRTVLDMIYRHQRTPEYQVRFTWEAGSIVIWDNFATQHYALADYYPQRRRMRRITVGGRSPAAARPDRFAKVA